jgi:uncharacterized 2Fe-2S/4Fe-4S cluster protein (DUF4445 family)
VISSGTGVEVTPEPFITRRYDPATHQTTVLAGERLLAVERGDTVAENYGLVVDIGTTTLVAALVDLGSGRELASASALNPQSLHAQDVLSRIRIAADPGGLALLQGDLIAELNRLAGEVARQAGIAAEQIYEAVFSGNTCMLHLAAGVDPAPLGRHPFTPVVTGGTHLAAAAIGLAIAPRGLVYLPPVISAYVGADISAGILAAGLTELSGVTLFIDIGTNGEIVLGRRERILVASTAAGTACEAGSIAMGMRAAPGAVAQVTAGPDGGFECVVIGGGEPRGLCGSGVVGAVAAGLESGAILPSGRLANGSKVLPLIGRVCLTQGDVRELQLAKGAIAAGMRILLKLWGAEADAINSLMLSGAFGNYVNPASAIRIGLVETPPDRLIPAGNTALRGAKMLLGCESYPVLERVTHVSLAADPDFQDIFAACMGFPAGGDRRPSCG